MKITLRCKAEIRAAWRVDANRESGFFTISRLNNNIFF
jgi:hypothetical protein